MSFIGPHFFNEITNLQQQHLAAISGCFDSGFTSCLVSLDLDVLKFALGSVGVSGAFCNEPSVIMQ